MRERFPVFFGIFAVMALSNAIVPVLPRFAEGAAAQGALYSAYFLGAFLLTLPAGILADRWGPVPVIQAGLAVTLISGLFMLVPSLAPMLLAGRLLEGFGAGLFVASGLAWVNARPDHERDSGIFIALMNIGLVTGLVASGLVIEFSARPVAGIVLFTAVSVVPVVAGIFMRNDRHAEPGRAMPGAAGEPARKTGNGAKGSGLAGEQSVPPGSQDTVTGLTVEVDAVAGSAATGPLPVGEEGNIAGSPGKVSGLSVERIGIAVTMARMLRDDFWLWVSAVILVGITGVVTALYPEFTGETAANLGLEIAVMNISTVIAVLLISRLRFPPVTTLRIAGLLMAVAVCITFFTPFGFIAIGVVAGVVMVAQLAFLAQAETQQGIAMGLWSTMGYAGMSLLPFIAGVIAEQTSFITAFIVTAFLAVMVALTIGRCSCRLRRGAGGAAED